MATKTNDDDARRDASADATRAPAALSYGSVFTHAKAGMENVDRERVARVVYDATAGTPHHENETRKERATSKRIAAMKAKGQGLTKTEWETFGRRADERARAMERTRSGARKWLVVDMDGFYAACEELYDPALKSVPVGVAAGPSSAVSYTHLTLPTNREV